MEKFLKIPISFALLILMICHAHASIHNGSPQHHKVRHKHNLFHFNDQRVNEIREAFDDYKNVVQKPNEDFPKLKPLRHHRRHGERVTDELTQTAINDRDENDETSIANPQGPMARYKRVHTTETTTTRRTSTVASKISENYDEEYDDDEDDKTKQKPIEEPTKVQVSCVITRLIKS